MCVLNHLLLKKNTLKSFHSLLNQTFFFIDDLVINSNFKICGP